MKLHVHKNNAYVHETYVYTSVFICVCAHTCKWGFPAGSVVKNAPANPEDMGDTDSPPGSGKFPGEGNGNWLQYSWLGNSMDIGAWWATVHGVAKNRWWLSYCIHTHTVNLYCWVSFWCTARWLIYSKIFRIFHFFPVVLYCKIWNLVPCPIQQDLVACLVYV